MKHIEIYKVTPAPWGDDYRLIETFDSVEDALSVLISLEAVNVNFNLYRVIKWDNNIKNIIYDSWKK